MRKFEFVSRMIGRTGEARKFYHLPQRSTEKSGGYDFYNPNTVAILPKKIEYIKTGVKAYMPDDEILILCNRSSNPKKKGLILINGVRNSG